MDGVEKKERGGVGMETKGEFGRETFLADEGKERVKEDG